MSSTSGDEEGSLPERKEAFRSRMRARRGELHERERALRSARVLEHVVAAPEWTRAEAIGFYVSVGAEVETRRALAAAVGEKRVAAPRVDPAEGEMAFAAVEDPREMEEGPLGVPEPHGPPVPADELDLVLVPGLAYDAVGRRLGRGEGYYDRFLADYGGWACGLAFAFQVVDEVPVGPDDVAVDAVATEHGLERAAARRQG